MAEPLGTASHDVTRLRPSPADPGGPGLRAGLEDDDWFATPRPGRAR
jgi:hypothetical protein